MTKLIYHTTNTRKKISPFDNEIIQIVTNEDVKIACPYLSLSYLNKITRLCKNWILLTDIEEFISSNNSINQRNEILRFIEKNQDRIRNYPDLHAKVIITPNNVFLGSANFTDKGVFKNNELSISISDKTNIIELNNWFDDWWNVADKIIFENINEFVKHFPLRNVTENSAVKLKTNTPKIRTLSAEIKEKKKDNNLLAISENEIISYLKKWNNNNWEMDFFHLIEKALSILELPNDDNYLTATLTKQNEIVLQLNNRNILKSHSSGRLKVIGFMLPMKFDSLKNKYNNLIHSKIEYFTDNGENELMWVKFDIQDLAEIDNQILNLWEKAIKIESDRKRISSHHKRHQKVILDIALDKDKLSEIFSESIDY